MFPYKDENPTFTTPVVTIALIAANVAVWVFIQGLGTAPALPNSVCRLGFIPGYLFGGIPPRTEISLGYGVTCSLGGLPAWLTVLTSMFMHGGWMHLIGNVWFLWVFGNNIEDSTGHGRFLVFYLLCGVIAALAQAAADPLSAIPMVGASGAISGVMGGYIVLYPRVRVHMLVFLFVFITRIVVPAYLMLGYWFLLQLLSSVPRISSEAGGIAFLAHAAGFVAGMVLVLFFRNRALVQRRLAHGLP
ncbi:MAG TPA: rhomboid family intramembrane serine protease [Gemmatimonadales bacterium]|nr:rhomboid family intramembrane serine protease [Gemmatimonadales bacterium]